MKALRFSGLGHFSVVVALAFTASLAAFAQGNGDPHQPCSTCVTGGGTAGTVPVFAPGSTTSKGIVANSSISQDGNGNINLGPIVDGQPSGTINGRLATFTGDNAGVIGYEKHIDPDNGGGISGVIGALDNTVGNGVLGRAFATTGTANGVRGASDSPDGAGVFGVAGRPGAQGNSVGVLGRTRGTGGTGVFGQSLIGGGQVEGVRGQVESPDGTAGVFVNHGGGNLIVGQGVSEVNKFRVDGSGNVFATGSFYPGSLADVAERIESTEALKPGDVVEIDSSSSGHFRKARSKFSTAVAGIISTAPAITLASRGSIEKPDSDTRPVLALVGRVPVRVNAEGGAIHVGDLLTTSSVAGVAMRCANRMECVGAIVGKALQPLDAQSGLIEALVTLQ